MGEHAYEEALFARYVAALEDSTQYRNWRRDNCGKAAGGTPSNPAPGSDVAKWDALRAKVLAGAESAPLPVMQTKIGDSFVVAGELGMSVSHFLAQLGRTPGQPAPVLDKLAWAPPVPAPGNTVNWTMTNANRMSSSLLSGAGRDLVITSGEPLTGPVQQLNGWRHVIWIGGKITDLGVGDRYALPISATGTVHIEGLDIRCDGDALMSRGGSATCVWQVQNCRFEVHFNGGNAEHSDCFQFQGGTKINSLRFDKCTMLTDYQGFMLRFPDAAAFMNGGDFRRLNFRRRIAGQDPAQAFLFVPDEDPATGHGAGQTQIGNIAMTDVWAEGSHSSPDSLLYPSWVWDSAFAAVGDFGNREGLFRLTDGTGQYVRPSTTADVVPPGGAASGQQAETAGWTGIIRLGIPPGGDFCPAGLAGHGYVSPGYV